MEITKQVTMLVPSELLYAFDPDAANIFVITRELGRLVARPLSEYQNHPECSRYEEGYNDGFEDGIAKGYTPNYTPVHVLTDNPHTGEILNVKLISAEKDYCTGEII